MHENVTGAIGQCFASRQPCRRRQRAVSGPTFVSNIAVQPMDGALPGNERNGLRGHSLDTARNAHGYPCRRDNARGTSHDSAISTLAGRSAQALDLPVMSSTSGRCARSCGIFHLALVILLDRSAHQAATHDSTSGCIIR
ncbi:hypothetical protein MRB53_036860 [Persea americana]|nr:hypothetical protein MRB53_036860 [Persea americana]